MKLRTQITYFGGWSTAPQAKNVRVQAREEGGGELMFSIKFV